LYNPFYPRLILLSQQPCLDTANRMHFHAGIHYRTTQPARLHTGGFQPRLSKVRYILDSLVVLLASRLVGGYIPAHGRSR
jgi:hypothetical protein